MHFMREFPQDKYRFKLYDNVNHYTMERIKNETGCDSIVNLGFFEMKTFAHATAIMIDGKWIYDPRWHDYGICIDKNGYMTVGTEKEATCDYIMGCPTLMVNNNVLSYNANQKGYHNGWTYTGIKADGTVVVWVNTKDNKMNTDDVEAALKNNGCVTIIRWDGSWSTQAIFDKVTVKPSQHRYCRSWLLIYKRNNDIDIDNNSTTNDNKNNEEKESNDMKTVVVDAGHGIEDQGNRSPDKSYYEHEFAYDMSFRIQKLLERHGVKVVLTRHSINKISLRERSRISNSVAPDLFVSLHSNASGNGQNWTNPSGFGIYTSSPGDQAGRNKAAKAVLNRAREANIKLWGQGLFHEMYYVLRNTTAPAILIEHAFHTNKHETDLLKSDSYRDKLAEVDAKGILDYLGIKWVDEDDGAQMKPTPTPIPTPIPTPTPTPKPEEDWEKEFKDAWDNATKAGIFDGTNPTGAVTRNQLAVILQRCGVIKI